MRIYANCQSCLLLRINLFFFFAYQEEDFFSDPLFFFDLGCDGLGGQTREEEEDGGEKTYLLGVPGKEEEKLHDSKIASH